MKTDSINTPNSEALPLPHNVWCPGRRCHRNKLRSGLAPEASCLTEGRRVKRAENVRPEVSQTAYHSTGGNVPGTTPELAATRPNTASFTQFLRPREPNEGSGSWRVGKLREAISVKLEPTIATSYLAKSNHTPAYLYYIHHTCPLKSYDMYI